MIGEGMKEKNKKTVLRICIHILYVYQYIICKQKSYRFYAYICKQGVFKRIGRYIAV